MIKLKELKEGNWNIKIWKGKTKIIAAATIGKFEGNPIETAFSSNFDVYLKMDNTETLALQALKKEIKKIEILNSN